MGSKGVRDGQPTRRSGPARDLSAATGALGCRLHFAAVEGKGVNLSNRRVRRRAYDVLVLRGEVVSR
jgi:hypothetical protein